MILIKNLTPNDVGKEVIYQRNCQDPEKGIITSWNDSYIFVVFNPLHRHGKACLPEDLKWAGDL